MTAKMQLAGEGDQFALGPNDELLNILNLDHFAEWHGVNGRPTRSGLRCIRCGKSVHFTLRKSDTRVWVAHNGNQACDRGGSGGGDTTVNHEILKLWCRDQLSVLGADVSIDEHQVGSRRTDVFAQFEDRQFAIEVQWSRLSREDVLRHTAVMASEGCSVLWLTWHCDWLAEVPAAAIKSFEPGSSLNYQLSQGLLYREQEQLQPRKHPVRLDLFLKRWTNGEAAWGYHKSDRGGWASVIDWENRTKANIGTITTQKTAIKAQQAKIDALTQRAERGSRQIEELRQHSKELIGQLLIAQREANTHADTIGSLSRQLSEGSDQMSAQAATIRYAAEALDGHLRRLQLWVDQASHQHDRLLPRRPTPPPRAADHLAQQRALLDLAPDLFGVRPGAAWWETKLWARERTRSAGGTRRQRWRQPLGAMLALASLPNHAKQRRSKTVRHFWRMGVTLSALIVLLTLLFAAPSTAAPSLAVAPAAAFLIFVAHAKRSVTITDRHGERVRLTRAVGCVEVTSWHQQPRTADRSTARKRLTEITAEHPPCEIFLDLLDWAEDNNVSLVVGATTALHDELYRRAGFTASQSAEHRATLLSRSLLQAAGKPPALVRLPGFGKVDRSLLMPYGARRLPTA